MINYIEGDVTETEFRPVAILHGCNDVGGFGAGVALAIAKKFPLVQQKYFEAFKLGEIRQGKVQWVLPYINDGIYNLIVGNMITQQGIISRDNPHPFKLELLENCLIQVAKDLDSTITGTRQPDIVLPRIGMGYGGFTGNWQDIELLLEKYLANHEVYVYDYQP